MPSEREARFWAKVDRGPSPWRDSPCWLWTGAKRAHGYGVFTVEHKKRLTPYCVHHWACRVSGSRANHEWQNGDERSCSCELAAAIRSGEKPAK